ncbi:MAG: (E)-4-hydroxy-3-methylbut-2-enyl-diphosphate synthase, partial [Cyclobacteriaceae bacterium]|nr:(E)-4-hydroxy-3-methylbut-2-enyl-diphosphate synthase [Cyclobacteriaceae bacterium]
MQDSRRNNDLYCESLTKYIRRKTRVVDVGGLPLGGDYPIRIQSMTTKDTMDTAGSVAQIERMVAAGCEYVRLTAPSLKEAQNLKEIKDKLKIKGIDVPLIADIHFTPNAAELAARIVEKVRINPGNYADKKHFVEHEYTAKQYEEELERIREKFVPLLKICKEYGTALRIGSNHGSLSDRIMSRYGDTPLGMVESALEFLRISESEGFYNVVLSMKSSNVQAMVQAYRLLVLKLNEEGLQPYPLHLGVTEAGEGEDGRIKSAVGIGALLEDGLGDTIRVSLTEEPEYEVPVAKDLVSRYTTRPGHDEITPVTTVFYSPYAYSRRKTREVMAIGGSNVPRVIADMHDVQEWNEKTLAGLAHHYLPEPDKWVMGDLGTDFIYTGTKPVSFMLPNGLREIVDYSLWLNEKNLTQFPLIRVRDYKPGMEKHPELNFVSINAKDIDPGLMQDLRMDLTLVVLLETENAHAVAEMRSFFCALEEAGCDVPVVINVKYSCGEEPFRLNSSVDAGGLFIDGMGDGIMLSAPEVEKKQVNSTGFGILQATRTRISRTEYISCPSCGRTLFDLQETTAMIRKRTDHLKGLKIGIMGCIVNGPGEM